MIMMSDIIRPWFDVLGTIATSVCSQKFESIALIFNCSGATITLCGLDEKVRVCHGHRCFNVYDVCLCTFGVFFF